MESTNGVLSDGQSAALKMIEDYKAYHRQVTDDAEYPNVTTICDGAVVFVGGWIKLDEADSRTLKWLRLRHMRFQQCQPPVI